MAFNLLVTPSGLILYKLTRKQEIILTPENLGERILLNTVYQW